MTVGTAVVVVGVLVDVGVGVGTLRGGAGRGALSVTLRDAGVSTLSGWVGCTCGLFTLRGGSGTVVGSFDVTFGVFCCGGRDCEGSLLCRTVTACLRACVSLSLSGSRGELVLGF